VETVLIVVQIAAFLGIATLTVVLIVFINKILVSIRSIEKDINTITTKASPVFDNIAETTRRINDITENIEKQIDGVIYSINSVKKIADDLVDFERRLKQKIEEPIFDAVTFFTAIVKGVKAFLERLRN